MKAATLNACINHWMKHVEKGKIVSQFKAVEDAHRCEKTPERNVSLCDDEEEDEAISMGGGKPSRLYRGQEWDR